MKRVETVPEQTDACICRSTRIARNASIPASLVGLPKPRWATVWERHWFWMLRIASGNLITPFMLLATRNAFSDPRQAAVLSTIRIVSGSRIIPPILRPIYRRFRSGHWPLLVRGILIFLTCA